MGRKSGKIDIPKGEAMERVLEQLRQGSTIKGAMESVNRNEVTFRQWVMADPDFKERSDKARLEGKGVKADLKNLKDISFEEFSEQFLDTKIFPHQKTWVDLLEGREPSWVHPSMTFEQGAHNRVLMFGFVAIR